jgi:hypothetical protein
MTPSGCGSRTARSGYLYGKAPLAQMQTSGAIGIQGDDAQARVFQTLFALPPKAPAPDRPA